MADVNAENIEDEDVQNAGKFLAYAIMIAIAGVIGIIIIIGLVVWVLKSLGLKLTFK